MLVKRRRQIKWPALPAASVACYYKEKYYDNQLANCLLASASTVFLQVGSAQIFPGVFWGDGGVLPLKLPRQRQRLPGGRSLLLEFPLC